jgi:hypothetical protein
MKYNQSGQTSRILLVLAAVILVAVIIVYLVMRMATPAPKPVTEEPGINEVPLPVYETRLGDIRFVFMSAINRGSILSAAEVIDSKYYNKKDLPISNPGAKFIQVTVGAQNKGTENIPEKSWDIENVVDSEGRNFVPLDSNSTEQWVPINNSCQILLKPAFDPAPCTKIYEVSKQSTGLKIRVITGKDNNPNNFGSNKVDSFLIDLIVK